MYSNSGVPLKYFPRLFIIECETMLCLGWETNQTDKKTGAVYKSSNGKKNYII